jgi:hypothetical protein
MEAKEKKVAIITLYRLLDSNTKGIYMVKTQLDKAGKKVKSAK